MYNITRMHKPSFKTPEISSVLYFFSALFAIIAFGILVWRFGSWFFSESNNDSSFTAIEDDLKTSCGERRKLDGLCLDGMVGLSADPSVVAVMIDNHPDARPPSGIDSASIIYEVPVEGGFTRFMAVFPADAKVNKVGPVRSARPYFLDWAQEYGDALYFHVGGSEEALNLIEERGVFSVNEFFRAKNFWRSEQRSAPHNTYTKSDLWYVSSDEEENRSNEYVPWIFEDIAGGEGDWVENIEIKYPSSLFSVSWQYSTSTGKYLRSVAGYPSHTEDGVRLEADNVIAQKVESLVLDGAGRLKINTIGEGEAEIFYNGVRHEAIWKKETSSGRTRWLDKKTLKEIPLRPGKTWVQIVDQNGSINSMNLSQQ